MVFQTDGNLVVQKTALGWTKPVWNSGTYNQGASVCVMQTDGNLVVYSGNTALWSTDTYEYAGSKVVMQSDGNLVVYAPGGGALWASNSVSAVPPTGPAASGSVVNPGECLAFNVPITSANGRFSLILQGDGNLVLYRIYPNHPSSALWSSDTFGKAVASCILQGDGNLVIYDMDANALWSSDSYGHANASLVMQDDGNAVIYPPGGSAVWATNTVQNMLPTGPSANGASVMKPGEVLFPGESIRSASGQFVMAFQTDGNLVWYNMNAGPAAVWASDTFGTVADICIMQTDGNLVIYDLNAQPLWSSDTFNHPQSQLVAQDDGNAVIYDPASTAIWSVRGEEEEDDGWWGWVKGAWNTVVGGAANIIGAVWSIILAIPILGGIIRTVWNWVIEVVWRILGGIDWLLSLAGYRPRKRMGFRVVIPIKNGNPIATPSDLQNMVDGAIATYNRLCNIELEFGGFAQFTTEPPESAINPNCGALGFFSDWFGWFGVVGSWYEIAATSTSMDGAWRKLVGYGPQIIVFAVRNVTPDDANSITVGCSFAATHDYVFVEPTAGRPQVMAHEIGHACLLAHRDDEPQNLMYDSGLTLVPTLTGWQISAIRGSRHCTYW
jgi:hypothetical protein